MLNPKDCKSGVEVIAIKNLENDPYGHPLSIGVIYTIERLYDFWIDENHNHVEEYSVSLTEVLPYDEEYTYVFALDQFKLRDPDEMVQLFNLDNIDADLLKEDMFETL